MKTHLNSTSLCRKSVDTIAVDASAAAAAALAKEAKVPILYVFKMTPAAAADHPLLAWSTQET